MVTTFRLQAEPYSLHEPYKVERSLQGDYETKFKNLKIELRFRGSTLVREKMGGNFLSYVVQKFVSLQKISKDKLVIGCRSFEE